MKTPGSELPGGYDVAGWTGLEPAASGVTGRRSNQTELPPHDVKEMVGRAGLEPTTLSV